MQVQQVQPTKPWSFSEFVNSRRTNIDNAIDALSRKLYPPAPVLVPEPTSYQKLIEQTPAVLAYLPDACGIMKGGEVLLTHCVKEPPVVARVVIAAFSTLNLSLVPAVVLDIIKTGWALSVALPLNRFIGLLEGGIRVVYLGAVSAALVGSGASGVFDFCQCFQLPAERVSQVMQAIFPWVGAVLRVSMIPQVMDISSGMTTSSKMSPLLEPFEGKQRYISRLPLERVEGDYNGARFTTVASKLYLRSLKIMSLLNENHDLYRKVGNADFASGATIRNLEARLNSWSPLKVWKASEEAVQLAGTLHEKSIVYVHNQVLGLSANLAAVMAMIVATNIIAATCFAMVSSLFYIFQTAHRQHRL